MEEKRRTIGYICPSCRQSVAADRSLFSLSVGHMKLPCPCGKSAFRVDYEERAYRITVPCAACGGEHQVTLTGDQLMGHKILGFSCPNTGIDCCYIGEEGQVFAALPRLEQTLDKQAARKEDDEGVFLDETIMSEILGELKDIAGRVPSGFLWTSTIPPWSCTVRTAAACCVCLRPQWTIWATCAQSRNWSSTDTNKLIYLPERQKGAGHYDQY